MFDLTNRVALVTNILFPKTQPRQVVERTLQALNDGIEQVMADDRAIAVDTLVRNNPEQLYADFQRRWEER